MIDLTCEVCRGPFQAKTQRAKYCGDRCRQRKHRGPDLMHIAATDTSTAGLLDSVLGELSAAGQAETVLGRQALVLADRIERSTTDTGSAFAALSRELRQVMAEALTDARATADPLDELERRRREKAAGA